LQRIISKGYYTNYNHISTDSDLESLHKDARWLSLLNLVKENKEKAEANLNKPLVAELDSIFEDDQKYRLMIDDYQQRYSNDAKETQDLWQTIHEKDSVNLLKVEAILLQYGWLGADVLGEQGSSTLWLVIQHADLKTQEKYLPMMKEAVKNRKARAADLALLVDRIEMRNGRPQIYGSQITTKDGKAVIYQIVDEINVNKRRAEVGLQPLEDYVKHWGIDYKLPEK
jgi:hypothetical protein